MLFIGIALLIAVGLGLLISADAGAMVGLTQNQTGQLVPMLVLLVVFAGALFGRRERLSTLVSSVVLWGAIFGVAVVGYTYRDDLSGVAARVFGELMPGTAIVDTRKGTVSFRAGRDGHFQVNTMVNGAEVAMLFDTGASAVVLSNRDAEAAGLQTDALDYTVPVSTANGTGRAAIVRIRDLEVGGIIRHNIRAYVAAPGALDMSLLGMSFLETLSRYSVSSSQLELAD